MFAVRAAHAFDGENFRAGGGTVLMEKGRIVGVEPVGYEPPSDCQLVDYGNATVLPGLIDTHVHLVGNSEVMALERVAGYSPEEIDEVVSESLRRQLAAGVTTVRDLGDRHFSVVQRRDAQRQSWRRAALDPCLRCTDHHPWWPLRLPRRRGQRRGRNRGCRTGAGGATS